MATIITSENQRKLMKNVVSDRQRGLKETFFFYHKELKEYCWGTNEQAQEQVKLWRKVMKQGQQLSFIPQNNKTVLISGKEWHILVLQHKTGSIGIDPSGLGLDDTTFIVDGAIYFFKHKESRDALYAYLTKPF